MNVISVYRKEIKYLISLPDRLYLLDALNQILTPDAYGGYNGYRVRSVYFDSIMNSDYLDKEDGTDHKKRVRLRVYDPKDEVAKFEIKFKSYDKELKETIIVSREDAKRILNRDFSAFLNYDNPTAEYAYHIMNARLYRPVSLVEYDRRAYTHEHFNTRITMDNNLRYCDFNYDLYSDNLNFKSAMPKDQTILEIKYDRFLFKQIQDLVSRCDLTGKPPSKFGSSRSLLREYYY